MRNYLKLVNFELSRFFKIYLVLAGLTIVMQLAVAYVSIKKHMDFFEELIYVDYMTVELFTEDYGLISLDWFIRTAWFNLPIVFTAAALIFYCFFIWYRDWLGKNTFIYRLLMLPTARINLYYSKATVIFLMVLGMIALQIILLTIQGNMLKVLVPANIRTDLSIFDLVNTLPGGLGLGTIIPTSFIQFLLHYAVGFMIVFIIFTSILFERSYRLKGIVYGVLYAVFAVLLFLAPVLVEVFTETSYLYPFEIFVAEIILWAVVVAMSIGVSHYLLKKKITV